MFSASYPFTLPTSAYSGGALRITTTDNTNNFGYWESPRIERIVESTVESQGTIYVAEFTVSSNVPHADAPTIRFRAASADFQHTDAMVLTSHGDGGILPTQAGRTYKLYFEEPLWNNQYLLDLDVLNFSASEAVPVASLGLHAASLQVYVMETSSLGAPAAVQTYDFTNFQTHGFTIQNAAPALVAPYRMEPTHEGLLIQGTNGGQPDVVFGYWGLNSSVPMWAGKLYHLKATISGNPVEPVYASAFRLRVNDSSLMYSRILNVDSTATGQLMPDADGNEYSLWFVPEPEINGSTFILSYDYLYVRATGAYGNDPMTMSKLSIESYDLP